MKMQKRRILAGSVAIVVGLTAYAFAAEPVSRSALVQFLPASFESSRLPTSRSDADAVCPPQACTIVVKTERGGPPSARFEVR